MSRPTRSGCPMAGLPPFGSPLPGPVRAATAVDVGPPQERPGPVTAAGIVALLWGGLGVVVTLPLIAVAPSLAPLAEIQLLTTLVLASTTMAGGTLVLASWSPKLLMDTCYIAMAVNLVALVVSASAPRGGSVFSGVLGLAVSGLVVALLSPRRSKAYFAARGLRY